MKLRLENKAPPRLQARYRAGGNPIGLAAIPSGCRVKCCNLPKSLVIMGPRCAAHLGRQAKDDGHVSKQGWGAAGMEMRCHGGISGKCQPPFHWSSNGKLFFLRLSSLPSWVRSNTSANPSGNRSPRSIYLPSLMAETRCARIGGRLM